MTLPRVWPWVAAGLAVALVLFWGGCRVERGRWVAAQEVTRRWQDSTSKAFALDTLRYALQIAAMTRESAALTLARVSSLTVANQAAAAARVSRLTVARARAALAAAATLRDSVTVQAELLTDQDTLILGQTREIAALRQTVATDAMVLGKRQQIIDTLVSTLHRRDVRLASLDSALRVAGTRPPTRLFGITVSPGVTLVGGAVLGVVGLYLLQARRP